MRHARHEQLPLGQSVILHNQFGGRLEEAGSSQWISLECEVGSQVFLIGTVEFQRVSAVGQLAKDVRPSRVARRPIDLFAAWGEILSSDVALNDQLGWHAIPLACPLGHRPCEAKSGIPKEHVPRVYLQDDGSRAGLGIKG